MLYGKGADSPSISAMFQQTELSRGSKIVAGSVWPYELQLLCSACLEWFGLHYSSENWRKMEKSICIPSLITHS